VAAFMESRMAGEDSVMLLFNASNEEANFTLPAEPAGRTWQLRLDTRDTLIHPAGATEAPHADAGGQWTLQPHSMAVFTAPPIAPAAEDDAQPDAA